MICIYICVSTSSVFNLRLQKKQSAVERLSFFLRFYSSFFQWALFFLATTDFFTLSICWPHPFYARSFMKFILHVCLIFALPFLPRFRIIFLNPSVFDLQSFVWNLFISRLFGMPYDRFVRSNFRITLVLYCAYAKWNYFLLQLTRFCAYSYLSAFVVSDILMPNVLAFLHLTNWFIVSINDCFSFSMDATRFTTVAMGCVTHESQQIISNRPNFAGQRGGEGRSISKTISFQQT